MFWQTASPTSLPDAAEVNPERFRAKWLPVRMKKTRQTKEIETRF
jgi:hypothetical protein